MPNYIVNTAQFNPIDFATRIKPMEEYAKNFNAQQDAIDAISLEGDSISSLITNNDEDKGLRDLYSSFDNSVGEAVSNMLSTGDISAGRRAIANLSRFYKKNLEPIKTAAAARSKAISDYEAIKQKDRSYLGTNPNQFGVSSYLNGATPSIYGVSGKDLYAMANADAVAASSRESNIEDYKLSKGLLEQYFVRGKEQGFNNQQIGNLLLGDVLNYKALSEKEKTSLPIERRKAMDYISSAYDRVASAYDINSLNTIDADGNIGITNDYTQAGTFILNGIYSGMTYKYDEDHLANQGYMDAYKTEQARKLKLENDAAEAAITGSSNEVVPINGDVLIQPTFDNSTSEGKKAKADYTYANTLISTPNGGVSTPSIASLDSQIDDLENIGNGYKFVKEVIKTTVPGTNAYTKLGETMSSRNVYYRIGPDGKRTKVEGHEEMKEAIAYFKAQDKKKALEKQREEELNNLSKFLEEYSSYQISGVGNNITAQLGAAVNNSIRSSYNTEFTPTFAGETDSRMRARAAQYIALTESTRTDNINKGSTGFYSTEGKALSKKQIEAIKKNVSASNITGVSEIQSNNRGTEGIKVTVQTNDDSVPATFIIKPSAASYINHNNELWSLKSNLLDFGDSIKNIPAYNTSGKNYYDVVINKAREQIMSGNITPITNSPDLYITQFKTFDDEGNPDVIKAVFQLTPQGFVPIGSTSARDIASGGEGYNGILTAVSSNYFNNLGAK